jgi:hypothetical protein
LGGDEFESWKIFSRNLPPSRENHHRRNLFGRYAVQIPGWFIGDQNGGIGDDGAGDGDPLLFALSIPARRFRRVVFPEPDGLISARKSLSAMSKVISCRTGTARFSR